MSGSAPVPFAPAGYEVVATLPDGVWSRYALARRVTGGPVVLGYIEHVTDAGHLRESIQGLTSHDSRFPAPIESGVAGNIVWYSYGRAAPTLAELLGEGAMTSEQVAALGAAAAVALHGHAGTRGAHGGISPATLQWDGAVVTITDSGVAVSAFGSGVRGAVSGGPYTPPELRADPRPTVLGDMYALGATLYEALTGKPPFGGRTTATVMASVLTDEIATVLDSGEQTPGHVAQSILRAIEKDPDDRWDSLESFASAIGGKRPVTPPRSSRPTPRPAKAGCLGVIALTITALGAWLAG